MDIYVFISLYVWITWVVTDIWWQFHVNSPFRNIFTKKNVDVFNTYFPRCITTVDYIRKILVKYFHYISLVTDLNSTDEQACYVYQNRK